MGTNYYLDHPQFDELLHIGKSSAGWRFIFQQINGIAESSADWRTLTKQGHIIDEYDKPIDYEVFWSLVEVKKNCRGQTKLRDESGDLQPEEFS